MSPFLVRCRGALLPADWLVAVRRRPWRPRPLVAPLLDLPRLRPPMLQPHIAARVGGSAEADLVPRPGVRVIALDAVLHEQHPVAMAVHPRPDVVRGRRLAVVDGTQYAILLVGRQVHEMLAPHLLRYRLDGLEA